MKNLIDEKYHSRAIDRKYSFHGILRLCLEMTDVLGDNVGLSYNWNKDTQQSYANIYNNIILPLIDDSIALEDYTKEDFLKIIEIIKAEHKSAETTNDHYEYLIRIVCEAGERFFNIPNCWNDIEVRTGNEVLDLLEGSIPKSFSDDLEFAIFKELMKPFDEVTGKDLGLLLLGSVGGRDGEIVALTFRDVFSITGKETDMYIRICKKVNPRTNRIDDFLKTKNGYRITPVFCVVARYISKYKHYLEERIRKGEIILPDDTSILDLPIAHKDGDYLKALTPSELSRAGVDLFIKFGFREEGVKCVCAERMLNLNGVNVDGMIDKDPTSYIFRRHFATRQKGMGLAEAEIHYLMGHSLAKDGVPKYIFSNEDVLRSLLKKMYRHPLNERASDLWLY